MNTLETILMRRSTRSYKSAPVERDKLEKIIEAGRYAPSDGNNQTNHFIVVQNPDVLQKLVSLAEDAFAKMEATKQTYSSLKSSIMQSKKGGYVFYYRAPVLIIVANQKNYGNNIADCAVAVENMIIAANALDLGSYWINQLKWLNEDPSILNYLHSLGLKENERVISRVMSERNSTRPNFTMTIILSNNEEYPFKGVPVEADRTLSQNSDSINVKAEFDNPQGILLPSMFAHVKVVKESGRNTLLVS